MAINLTWPTTEAAWQRFLTETGLEEDVALRALYLGWYARTLGRLSVAIESAFRSQSYQLALQKRWDSGDRAGLISRPATNSMHSTGRAFDIRIDGPNPSPQTWEAIGRLGEALGLRWGGRFSDPDPVHFDR